MSHSIPAVGAERVSPPLPSARPGPGASSGAVSFAETLAAQPTEGLGRIALDAAREMARGQERMDRAVLRARRGEGMEPAQLLALQAGVYRTTQELELASKLVDKATGAIKQTLQSQR